MKNIPIPVLTFLAAQLGAAVWWGAQIDAKSDYDGYTALIWAAKNGHTKVAKILIDNGANVNSATNFDKYTSLIDAALNSVCFELGTFTCPV